MKINLNIKFLLLLIGLNVGTALAQSSMTPPESEPSQQPSQTEGANTAINNPEPASVGQVSTQGPSITDALTKLTGCKPAGDSKCELTVGSTVDFLTYAKQCQSLKGWVIHYKPANMMTFTLLGGDKPGCQVEVDDHQVQTSPRTISCSLTSAQLNAMTTNIAFEAAKEYDADKSKHDALMKVCKPIVDCIGPPVTITGGNPPPPLGNKQTQ